MPISGFTSAEWLGSQVTTVIGSVYPAISANPGDPVMRQSSSGNATTRQNFLDFMNNNVVDLSTASTFDIADLRLAFQIQKFMERNSRSGVRYTEFLKAHYGVVS